MLSPGLVNSSLFKKIINYQLAIRNYDMERLLIVHC